MNGADCIVIIVLCTCIILAYRTLRKRQCHDCIHCYKNCRGEKDGRKFENFIENQRDAVD